MGDDLDALISKLGISLDGVQDPEPAPAAAAAPAWSYGPAQTAAPQPAAAAPSEADMDSLISSLGISIAGPPQPSGRGGGRGGFSSGPGPAGRGGFSSGPGAAGRGGFSSGPGAAGRAGFSSGPGAGRAGFSCGPGAGRAGPNGVVPMGRPMPRSMPDIQPAQQDPEGRKLTFTGPPCATCTKMIIGKIITANGKNFHPECFVCVHCKLRILEGAPFVEEQDQIYCEEHYLELFGEKCHNCKGPIVDKCVRFLDRLYHPNHFTCFQCGQQLKEFKEDEGEPFCTTCKALRVRQRAAKHELCALCKLPLTGDFLLVNGQKMHPEHYKCEICGVEFIGGNCKEWEGKNYCRECWEKLIKTVCAGCLKPIIGRSLNAMLRLWHPECFVCTVCKEALSATQFWERAAKPYCQYHYIKLFGAVCARCQKKCEGEVIEALNKTWHPECWICNGCNKPLKDRVFDFESKPLCKNCFGHLPKEIQKEIKAKEDAAKKKEKEQSK